MENTAHTEIKLTRFSRGAGCGCKISPQVLEEILRSDFSFNDASLLVGNNTNDDAAVYDMGNGNALVTTTDFFMPIVDDAYDFGRAAAANAISDVYAMGAKPLVAIAVLGWPLDKIPAYVAKDVLNGARDICAQAGISLAGGHSIDAAEPFFGLCVNGITSKENLKKNNTARAGDHIFLTKPVGVGILSTAQKRGALQEEHAALLIRQLTRLNAEGEKLGKVKGVSAMTDVTGFGLAGHLIEMAEGSGLSAEIHYSRLPVCEGVRSYLAKGIIPDATYRNWNSYSSKINMDQEVNVMEAFSLLPDPQTNGGLLIAVSPEAIAEVQEILKEDQPGTSFESIGIFTERKDFAVYIKA